MTAVGSSKRCAGKQRLYAARQLGFRSRDHARRDLFQAYFQ